MSDYARQLEMLHRSVVGKAGDSDFVSPVRTEVLAPETRIAVYANGYAMRLVDATLEDYPALAYYMGGEACREAVRAFVDVTPSNFWDLNLYPAAFADYMDVHCPDAAAKDIARLESAVTTVFWAKSSVPLSAGQLMALSEEALGTQPLHLRNEARLLHFHHAANAYVTLFRKDEAPQAVVRQDEYILVLRDGYEVRRLELEPAEYAILKALDAGKNLNDALADAGDETVLESALPGYMNRWLQHGFFRAC